MREALEILIKSARLSGAIQAPRMMLFRLDGVLISETDIDISPFVFIGPLGRFVACGQLDYRNWL